MAEKKVLVIVESPTKANTIRKFLPKNFVVESSLGHIRDLPQSAADIPAALKKSEWAKLGVNVDDNFDPLYVVPKDKLKKVKELKDLLKNASELYLATDEDREGESISWHLLEILKPKIPVKRMVFHEITKKAILEALEKTRDVDTRLVRAQETRRILDRLYGYTLSPLLWKKIAYGLSAGRVQSTGLKMIVERERERILFKKSLYMSLKAKLTSTEKQNGFESRLTAVKTKRVATGKDFNETTGELLQDRKDKVILLAKDNISLITQNLQKSAFIVDTLEEKDVFSSPSAPFITSTLQQEANRKLGLSARDTMRVAQKLYEEGLITYMRTDSPTLSSQAVEAARSAIIELYGKEFVAKEARQYSAKQASAQEAHEAIRPAGSTFVHPDKIEFIGKEKSLYELIWKRTMASQMERAQKRSMTVKFVPEKNKDLEFTSNGLRIVFPGYLRAYVEGSDDPESALEDQDVILPPLKVGDKLNCLSLDEMQHETRPPARYTEASLIQRLEKEGIGRPSTYASIISTVLERGYVRKEANALIPSLTGMAVIQLLEKYFSDLISYKFTSGMEEDLDRIASGEGNNITYLKKFYLGATGLRDSVSKQEKNINSTEGRTVLLPHLTPEIELKIGRYGPYVVSVSPKSPTVTATTAVPTKGAKGKKAKDAAPAKEKNENEQHASIPEDVAPADLTVEKLKDYLILGQRGPEPLGTDPVTGKPVFCLVGRYGAYVQLGEKTDDVQKPKRASLGPQMDPKTITLETALHLLKLPRELGIHPVSKKPIIANAGKFGPYVMCDGDFRSIGKNFDVYTITFDQGLDLLNQPKVASRGATMLREMGAHPKDGKKISVYDGKYGLFLKHGTKNYSVPEEQRKKEFVEKWKMDEILGWMSIDKNKTKS